MKFLIDEDVPKKALKILMELGHDSARVKSSSRDIEIARQAKKEGRILITLDKDFTNASIFSPKEFNIVRIQIHPPYADAIVEALKNILDQLSPDKFRGLIILQKNGHIRIPE